MVLDDERPAGIVSTSGLPGRGMTELSMRPSKMRPGPPKMNQPAHGAFRRREQDHRGYRHGLLEQVCGWARWINLSAARMVCHLVGVAKPSYRRPAVTVVVTSVFGPPRQKNTEFQEAEYNAQLSSTFSVHPLGTVAYQAIGRLLAGSSVIWVCEGSSGVSDSDRKRSGS